MLLLVSHQSPICPFQIGIEPEAAEEDSCWSQRVCEENSFSIPIFAPQADSQAETLLQFQ